jgi:hypothetical protein
MRTSLVLLMLGSSIAAAQSNVEEANQRVEAGEQLFAAGNYDGALAEFDRAYEVIGEHPNRFLILYNIGQAHERRFRYDLAMQYYRRYLDEGGGAAPDRAAVEASIRNLQGMLATLHIQTNVPAQVWIGDRQFGEAPGDVLVPGGLHMLEVRADGYGPSRRQIQVAARTDQTLSFTLEEMGASLEPAWFGIASALALASVGVAAGLGGHAMARSAEIDEQLADPVQRWAVGEEERREIQTLTLSADIMFGVAGAFAITAIILALFTSWGAGGDEEPLDGATARFSNGRFELAW